MIRLTVGMFLMMSIGVSAADGEDPNLWLEEVEGERALEWVEQTNRATLDYLEAMPTYKPYMQTAEKLLNAQDRLLGISHRKGYVYNFWQDKDNVRGVWRRCKQADFRGHESEWEVLLSIDELAEAENKNWVFKGSQSLPPDYNRCLLSLSDGGKDAVVVREFDIATKSFPADGFVLPEAKTDVGWHSQDKIWVGTDFGPGSLTNSGYPRQVKLWNRGTPLEDATLVFEGDLSDVASSGFSTFSEVGSYQIVRQAVSFFEAKHFVVDAKTEELVPLPIPISAELQTIHQHYLLFSLRESWQVGEKKYESNTLLSIDLRDPRLETLDVVRVADSTSILQGVSSTRDFLVLKVLENVRGKLLKAKRKESGWRLEAISLGDFGEIDVMSSSKFDNDLYAVGQGYLKPKTLSTLDLGQGEFQVLMSQPDKFATDELEVQQFFATSRDGTRIPYSVVSKKDMVKDGTAPTLLYGYGGFEISLTPGYNDVTGKLWLEQGGVYVVANIRGGGEFGPRWHRAALKENRQLAYDDFIAVSEDLIARKITSPEHLGIYGGSNGGLLVGAVFVQRPDLYQAVVCAVPLLDMIRYTQLPPGASWIGEYGDPENPEIRATISQYSPYQNVKADADYPEVYFFTSTKDDRVHPGHARKMVKKMTDQGHKVYYYENTEGGHAGSANLLQRARNYALLYSYLNDKLR